MSGNVHHCPHETLKVITFDGGPSPLVTIRVLLKLEDWLLKHGKGSFIERADMFVGTSDGGLMSLLLAHSLSKGESGISALQRCISFSRNISKSFKADTRAWLRLLGGTRAMLAREVLEKLLQKEFGTTTLKDLMVKGKLVSIAAFDIDDCQLTTYHAFEPGGVPNMSLVDVGLATSALPLVLPPFKAAPGQDPYRKQNLIVDGVFASNSTVTAALSDAILHLANDNHFNSETMGAQNLHRIQMLSIGSKSMKPQDWREDLPSLMKVAFKALDFADQAKDVSQKLFSKLPFVGSMGTQEPEGGMLLWGEQLLSMMNAIIDGSSQLDDRIAKHTLGRKRYHRFQPETPNYKILMTAFDDPMKAEQIAENRAKEIFDAEVDRHRQNKLLASDNYPTLISWLKKNWLSEEIPQTGGLPISGRCAP
jgi:patatin-like phospholipase/acyl hydrolase